MSAESTADPNSTQLPKRDARVTERPHRSTHRLTPSGVYFVAERRKPSGITLRNTNDSPGGSRRAATIHPSVGSKVDGIGHQPAGSELATEEPEYSIKTPSRSRERSRQVTDRPTVQLAAAFQADPLGPSDTTESPTTTVLTVPTIPSEAASSGRPEVYTIDELVAMATVHSPELRAATKDIQLAEAQVLKANTPANPDFVLDFNTPLHDDGPSEISTRVTLPIGQDRSRRYLQRAANATVAAANATQAAVLDQLQQRIRETAIEAALQQDEYQIERKREQIKYERVRLLNPSELDGDPAEILVRFIDAQTAAVQATERRMETHRELDQLLTRLSVLIGEPTTRMRIKQPTLVADESDGVSLDQVVSAAQSSAAKILSARASLAASRYQFQSEVAAGPNIQMGPRYKDQLGEDDDSVGVRFRSVLPFHDTRRGQVDSARALVGRNQANVAAARDAVIQQAVMVHRELESVRQQVHYYQHDSFVQQQQAVLDEAAEWLTGLQTLTIEEAILLRRQQRLRAQYQLQLLTEQLRSYFR